MPSHDNPAEPLYARDRRAWRKWLEKNHATASGVWLVMRKKASHKPCVSYGDSVEEALCFGWIDSQTRALDAERFVQHFTPRKPHSIWSPGNRQRVEQLIQQGLMTPAGREKIEAARQDGSWSQMDAVEALQIPADLEKALSDDPTAQANFAAFSASSRKIILWWIESAKRPETRMKRIQETVKRAANNTSVRNTRQ